MGTSCEYASSSNIHEEKSRTSRRRFTYLRFAARFADVGTHSHRMNNKSEMKKTFPKTNHREDVDSLLRWTSKIMNTDCYTSAEQEDYMIRLASTNNVDTRSACVCEDNVVKS